MNAKSHIPAPASHRNNQPLGMPAAVREALVAGLAAILVADYQQYHDVPAFTVTEGPGLDRPETSQQARHSQPEIRHRSSGTARTIDGR